MNPTKASKKLTERLAEQIEKGEPQSAIEETKQFIEDSEESVRFIQQEQEDAIFFKFDPKDNPYLNRKENSINLNESDDEDVNQHILSTNKTCTMWMACYRSWLDETWSQIQPLQG